MRNAMIAGALLGALHGAAIAAPVPEFKPYSYDAMGCMKLRECTDQVHRLTDVDFLEEYYPGVSFASVKEEANEILQRLETSGVQVYLAHGQYFPPTHRGSYYTDTNTFFLNDLHMYEPETFIKVLRHEGWHAAQDCMAGGINNSMIAVIYTDEEVPGRWKVSAEARYGMLQPKAIPWEQEAIWAGNTPGMTNEALDACASPLPMWEVMEPTPKTQQWLRENGYYEY